MKYPDHLDEDKAIGLRRPCDRDADLDWLTIPVREFAVMMTGWNGNRPEESNMSPSRRWHPSPATPWRLRVRNGVSRCQAVWRRATLRRVRWPALRHDVSDLMPPEFKLRPRRRGVSLVCTSPL